jgi:hypothetical protein
MAVTSDKLGERSAGRARAGVPLAVVWFVGAWLAGVPTSHAAASSPSPVSEAFSADSGATYSGEYSADGRHSQVQLASARLALPVSTSGAGQSQQPQSGECGIFQKQSQIFQLPACSPLYSTPPAHSTGGGGHSAVHPTGGGGHSPVKHSGSGARTPR